MLIICLPLSLAYFHANPMLQDYSLRDPPLSQLGIQQCQELQEHLQKNLDIAQKVELIVISPMRRTLQTAQLSLGWLLDQGISSQIRGEWQGMKVQLKVCLRISTDHMPKETMLKVR